MSSKFDLCLLLYVIRLVGWLKHCNLSLSILTHIDAVLRYTWIGLCLGFPYAIDLARLERALRDLLRVYTSLAGRCSWNMPARHPNLV